MWMVRNHEGKGSLGLVEVFMTTGVANVKNHKNFRKCRALPQATLERHEPEAESTLGL